MRRQFLTGYILIGVLILWSLIAGNYEFVIYAGATIVLLGFLHWTDKRFHYSVANFLGALIAVPLFRGYR